MLARYMRTTPLRLHSIHIQIKFQNREIDGPPKQGKIFEGKHFDSLLSGWEVTNWNLSSNHAMDKKKTKTRRFDAGSASKRWVFVVVLSM